MVAWGQRGRGKTETIVAGYEMMRKTETQHNTNPKAVIFEEKLAVTLGEIHNTQVFQAKSSTEMTEFVTCI